RNSGRLLQQIGSGRRLRFKRKRAIGIDCDHDRDFQIGIHLRGLGVERLAELHDVHAVLTERRTNRRRRISLPGGHLQLYITCNLLCHLFISNCRLPIANFLNRKLAIGNRQCFHSSSANVTFSTSKKFNSTGVDRPKIVTVTFSVDLSSLTSSTLPVKLWNGPDLIRTVSPAAYENFGFGFSAASACWFTI